MQAVCTFFWLYSVKSFTLTDDEIKKKIGETFRKYRARNISQKRSVWQSQSSSFYSPLLVKGLIVLVESKSNFKTFFAKTLEESWSSDSYLNRNLSNPISNSGFIIVGDFEGYIHIIDPVNGKTVGRKKISKKSQDSIKTSSFKECF